MNSNPFVVGMKVQFEGDEYTVRQFFENGDMLIDRMLEGDRVRILRVHWSSIPISEAKKVKHSENADQVIADLMNALDDGSITPISQAHVDLTNAVNTYLLERGFKTSDLGKLWTGEIQLTSS